MSEREVQHETGAHCDRAGLASRCSSRCWQRHGQGLAGAREGSMSNLNYSATSADVRATLSPHASGYVLACAYSSIVVCLAVGHSSPPDLLVGCGPRPDTAGTSGWARHPGRDWQGLHMPATIIGLSICSILLPSEWELRLVYV